MTPLLLLLHTFLAPPANRPDYAQYYGYPDDPSVLSVAALSPHDPFFARMRPDAIKAPHGHFQHIAPAALSDDFPYADFKSYEAAGIAAGKPPLLVTATFRNQRRPVYFAWSLELNALDRPTAPPDQWAQAVNLRDDRYIRFFAAMYVRRKLWPPESSNYWIMVDNCSFWYDLYGVLDDQGFFHRGIPWDQPFAATEAQYLDSIVYFLRRLKELAPDIRIMGNEGSLTDESQYARIWSGFDGAVREDITAGFQPDARSREQVYTFYRRYQYLAAANKVAILRSLLPKPDSPGFADKLRTSYAAYLIFRGPRFYYAPRFDDGTVRGVPLSDFADMRDRLGWPAAPVRDEAAAGKPYLRFYSRECEGGMVFLNYSGAPREVSLPPGYYDRNGDPIASIVIPDLAGDYVLKGTGARAPRPVIDPPIEGPVSGPLHVTVTTAPETTARCTFDGTEPRANSPVCPQSLDVKRRTTLRACSFSPDLRPSFTASSEFDVRPAPPRVAIWPDKANDLPCASTLLYLDVPSARPVTVTYVTPGQKPQEIVFPPGERFKHIPVSQLTLLKAAGAVLSHTR